MVRRSFIFNRSPILPYWGWNTYTPVIPKLYWDCESAEQALKNLYRSFDKLTHYASYIAEYVNGLDFSTPDDLQNLRDKLENEIYEIKQMIDEITESGTELIWNVYKGAFDTSVSSMRDLFNFVTEKAYRCEDIASFNVTVSQAANSGLNVEGWAVCNSYYFKNKISDVLPQYTETA